ncbi:MAG: RidA family protein [Acidobacteriaceae bacterium]|nr:RidA family protein [Acidobacteriaceae bacterium]
MAKQIISTPDAPQAIGPYSQAVRLGNMLFTSGQIPLDPATGEMITGDITAQTERVVANLQALLKAAGFTVENVVKTTVFLKDMNDFAAMNAVYTTVFAAEGAKPPARSTIQVARLPKDALVEIEVTALLD